MSETESTQPNKSKIETLSSMTVAELKKYLETRGVTVNGYLKPALLEIAQAVEKMMLPVEPIMNVQMKEARKIPLLLIVLSMSVNVSLN